MTWIIIPLLSAILALFSLMLSDKERKWPFKFSIFLILLLNIAIVINNHSEFTKKELVREIVLEKLNKNTTRFIDLISDALFCATDGWWPSNQDEFFSFKTANIISNELNIKNKARFRVDDLRWYQAFNKEANNIDSIYNHLLSSFGNYLESDLIILLIKFKDSRLIMLSKTITKITQIDEKYSFARVPLLAWQQEKVIEKDLIILNKLYKYLRNELHSREIYLHEDWLKPIVDEGKKYFGMDRFDKTDLLNFRNQNPDAPNPMRFGKGDPRKNKLEDTSE